MSTIPKLILRKTEVCYATGLSPRTIDRLEAKGEFPARIRISHRTVGWHGWKVQEWVDARQEAAAGF